RRHLHEHRHRRRRQWSLKLRLKLDTDKAETASEMGLRNVKLLIVVLLGALVLAAPAVALAGQSSFALRPLKFDPTVPATKSYFILALRPGERISSRFVVSNVGTSSGTAFLYPVDATTG